MREQPLAVLHLLLTMGETSSGYNEHCLPMADRRAISICTYYKPQVTPPGNITVFAGDDTVPGFFRALRAALAAREYDIIHAHSVHVALFFLMAGLLGRARLIPSSVVTLHTSFPNYKLRNRLIVLPAFALFRRLVCCSYASFDSFPSFFKRLAGERLCVVQNGLDVERLDGAARRYAPKPPGEPFTLVAVGRLIPVKNPLVAQRAFREADDRASRMVFVGEGHLRELLVAEQRPGELAGRVELTGLVPRERVYEHLIGSDVFISTSRIEGLPVAVIEAMACRRPVILSDIPPHREIAAGADFIPLVPPDDVAGFAREIERLRRMSPAERASIGERCRAIVQERFSLDAMHRGYDAVYGQVLGQVWSGERVY